MKKKQVIIFMLLVLMLLVFNKIFMTGFQKTSTTISTQDLVIKEQISSQKLFEKNWHIIKRDYYEKSMNNQDWNRWKEHYRGKIKTDEDVNIAVNTMLASLDDPYSRYMTKREFSDQNTSIDSKISGIGVNIATLSGKVYVVSVIEGTPAYYAKLMPEDIILEIDGKNTNGMQVSDVAQLVRGPENSVVELTILRKKEKFKKSIKRKEIKIKTVKSSIDKNIGYIQILSFIGATTPSEFIDALQKTENTDALILDLRGNTGGLLPNAIFIANMFITKGNLVSIVGRNGYRRDIKAQANNFDVDKPTIVLVDGGSASASEILSGALKDYNKAKLLGTTTFGKGMVQKIIPLPNETGLNLTIAKYLTPSGHDINKKGIKPDIEVRLSEKDILSNNDVQLKRAKDILNKMVEKK